MHISFSINRTKLTRYLLDVNHPVGGAKAKFFLAHGFSLDDIDGLAAALLNHTSHPPRRVTTPHGLRLIYDGPIPAPNGAAPMVRSVWQQAPGEPFATLITAYPL